MNTIRAYELADKATLLDILRLNTPKYFDPTEESGFVAHLTNEPEDYFVVEAAGRIVGSGGVDYKEDGRTAHLSWGMLHPDYQRQGIGKKLTLHRIAVIKKRPTIKHIVVRTSQLVFPFYEKVGFILEKTEKNFWGKGLDLYEMKIEL